MRRVLARVRQTWAVPATAYVGAVTVRTGARAVLGLHAAALPALTAALLTTGGVRHSTGPDERATPPLRTIAADVVAALTVAAFYTRSPVRSLSAAPAPVGGD